MKTTQRTSYRRGRLALLVGAVLMAALAVAVALLLRQNDQEPAEKKGSQEIVGGAAAGDKTDHAASSSDASGEAAQELELSEESSRLEQFLSITYEVLGDEPDPKKREWIEWHASNMIAEGASDEELGSRISTIISVLRHRSPEDLEKIYKRWEDSKQGVVETDGWKYDPNFTEKQNRIDKYLFEHTEDGYIPHGEKTPRAVIEILVEGMDDLTAAKYLSQSPHVFPDVKGEYWHQEENEYAAEYANRVLASDPSSRDALIVKMGARVDVLESARLLIEHHPTDDYAVMAASGQLFKKYPEEAVAAILNVLPEDGPHVYLSSHMILGGAYERLDMLYEAAEQFQIAFAAGRVGGDYRFSKLERGERNYPSIWEERAAAAAEAAKQAPPPAEASAPQRPPGAPASPDTPRGVEPPPPPPNLEAEMSAAYANFAKAYQSAFEMEYALSEATPEGYMNALLGMARAFARAGDAKRGQDAYNAARKCYSPEEIQQAFRRFDDQDRLRREASNDEDEEDE